MLRIRILLCVALCLAAPARAAKPPPLGADEAPADFGLKPPPMMIPRAVAPGPVFAPGQGTRPVSSGSGFAVTENRALTDNHVVAGCARVVARNSQNRLSDARVEAVDPRRDLALIDLPAEFAPPLIFRESPEIERGESVVAYGFPLAGLLSSGPSLTTGSVTALTGLRDTPLHFQISAPVQPGNSGGPLLDDHGHVIGVVVSKLNAARVAAMTGGDIPQNVNFAIKGTEAAAFLREHDVNLETAASSGPELGAAEVGRIADPSTLFLRCFR